MRFFRTICAPAFVLAIPAFLAFQMAARPIMSCGEEACELLERMMPCLDGNGSACAEVAQRTGCCLDDAPAPTSGCCAQEAPPKPKASPCSGCADKRDPEPMCDRGKQTPTEKPNRQCPEGKPLCLICPTVPVAAEPSPTRALRGPSTQILAALHIPKTTTEAPRGPLLIESHAPPFSALARAGPERRTALCSFLL